MYGSMIWEEIQVRESSLGAAFAIRAYNNSERDGLEIQNFEELKKTNLEYRVSWGGEL